LPDGFQVNGVGIQAMQDFFTPDRDVPADFDYFEMTEGWGFLPEGYHDYDSGDVPNWNCGVGGWATDPDDRLTDVAIEVGIDGTSLPYWLYASDYREDLYNAGVCEDGNCSFSMSLWDVMSSYETHSIVTYAQDLQSGEWVQLSNSPKDLTCRTYDIYGYNPLTGTTEQLTDIRDAGEYNPSFSPNGKLVAHDVVAFDGSQSIYITDLTTGTSTPLSGAEAGGNDAAWSPNGKWILFDTAWTDTPNLYIVPVTGGTPILVRENGISGDWAPNGKRIVFQDMDGSLRTIAVNKSSETYLIPNGLQPAWSPDGNWIAYTDNGDIWKLPVNIHGMPQGEPIQLTSGMRWDEQPTWSMDNLTIIFHAGLGPDYDLWSVPAAGGDPVWLTGAVEFGDYDPAVAKNSASVAYSSFSPEGQTPRTWVTVFTYDLPADYWTEGTHSYHFETAEMGSTPEISFDVLGSEPLYDGNVLMRGSVLRGRSGEDCFSINAINPAQASQFNIGWTADGTYAEALSQLEALMPTIVWDGGAPMSLFQHEVFPFTSQVDWGGYICSFTYP
jgi:Tol biopolymer transport system component